VESVGWLLSSSAGSDFDEGLRRLITAATTPPDLALLITGNGPGAYRRQGQVLLQAALDSKPIQARSAICAHPAGRPTSHPATDNASSHISRGNIAIVHNGIIETTRRLRLRSRAWDYSSLGHRTEVIDATAFIIIWRRRPIYDRGCARPWLNYQGAYRSRY